MGVRKDFAETLSRLRLRKKYTCVLVDENDVNFQGMIKRVKDFVAYGPVDEKTLIELVKARGKMADKSEIKDVDASKIAKDLLGGKKMSEVGLKPFFRLHPPRKGIKSKLHYPRGALGDHKKDINKLVERML